MKRLVTSFLACLLFLPTMLFAQTSAGLISQPDAQRIGLQRMWFTQIQLDSGFGQLKFLTQHVSSSRAVTIHQVTYDGGRFVVSERELDRFGKPLGPDGAKRAAETKFTDLTTRKLNPKSETVVVPQITLYAVTDSGLVHAIDAETGRSIWKAGLGNPLHPMESAGTSDDYVAAINGTTLYLLKSSNGEVIWKRSVGGVPGAGTAITPSRVFVPMVNGAMEAYDLESPRNLPKVYRSQGRAMFQPVYTGTNVAWTTDRGHLYVSGALDNQIAYRLEANDAIGSAASIMPPGKLIVTSIDGFVYCLQESGGILMWRFSSGEPIVDTPVVYGDTVYAVTADKNLYAIDGELGQERWSTSGIARIVGASRDRIYCLTEARLLAVLDQRTGSQLGTHHAELIELPYVNKETDRLFIASSRGMIQCFREIQNEHPVLHIGLTKREERVTKPKKSAKAADEKAPAPVIPATDPFGDTPAGASEEEKPPSGDAAKSDDPFGS